MATITARLADLVSDVVLTSAHVTSVEQIAAGFVKVELTSPGFRKTRWTPGDKVQMRPERGGLQLRTYTPISWDNERGTTELIGLTREHGPGADWFRQVATGRACEVLGPRRSIDLSDTTDESIFVGDESSVGLACALRTVGSNVDHVFEAADPVALSTVLETLGFAPARCTVVGAGQDRMPLLEHVRDAASATTGVFDVIATGDAAMVHALRRDARQWQRKARKTKGKAYWAAGRTGLD